MSMKKICCLLMTAIIVLSILAVPAFATEEKETPEETTVVTEAASTEEPEKTEETEETTDASSESKETSATEETSAPEKTTAPPEPVDIVVYPDANGMFATVNLVKKDGTWQVVEEVYYEKEKDIPTTVAISPESGDKHANIILEKVDAEDDSTSKWQITGEHYYASKLLVLPIAIVVFLIALALMVMLNLILIKLHKR